jgi:hypothetical protein
MRISKNYNSLTAFLIWLLSLVALYIAARYDDNSLFIGILLLFLFILVNMLVFGNRLFFKFACKVYGTEKVVSTFGNPMGAFWASAKLLASKGGKPILFFVGLDHLFVHTGFYGTSQMWYFKELMGGELDPELYQLYAKTHPSRMNSFADYILQVSLGQTDLQLEHARLEKKSQVAFDMLGRKLVEEQEAKALLEAMPESKIPPADS